jgi:hypothetical protein
MQSGVLHTMSAVLERQLLTRLLTQRVSESEPGRSYLAPASLLPMRASSLRALLWLPRKSIEMCSLFLVLFWNGGGRSELRDREIIEPKNDTSLVADVTK